MNDGDTKAANTDDQDAEWGFKKRKRRMSKESRIGLVLILILLITFGVVVYDKLNPNHSLMAFINGETTSDDEDSVSISPPKNAEEKTDDDGTREQKQDPFDENAPTDFDADTPVTKSEKQNANSLLFTDSIPDADAQARADQTRQQGASDASTRAPFGQDESRDSRISNPRQSSSSESNPFFDEPDRRNGGSPNVAQTEADPFGESAFRQQPDSHNIQQATQQQQQQQQQQTTAVFDSDQDQNGGDISSRQTEPARQLPDTSPPFGEQTEPNQPTRSIDENSFFPEEETTAAIAQEANADENVNRTELTGEILDGTGESEFKTAQSDSRVSISPTQDAFVQPAPVSQTGENSQSLDNPSRQSSPVIDNVFAAEENSEPSFADSERDSKFGGYQPVAIDGERAGSSTIVRRPAISVAQTDATGLQQNTDSSNEPWDNSIDQQRQAQSFEQNPVPSPNSDFVNQNNIRRQAAPFDGIEKSDTSPVVDLDAGFSKGTRTTTTIGSTIDTTANSNIYPTSPVTSAGDSEYVVQPGDNYWSISKKQYGTIRYFQALAKFNQNRNADPQRLRPGMKLLTPSREVLQRQFPKLIPAAAPKTGLGANQFADRSTGRTTFGPSGTRLPGNGYVIQSGDNFWTISKKLYGSAGYFQALTAYNQSFGFDPKRLRPGTRIAAPSRATLQAKYPKLVPKAATRVSSVVRKNQSPGFFIGSDGTPMYLVGGQETLSGISKSHLGRSSRWVQIYQLNKSRLSSPDNLTIGTILRLPTDASSVRLAESPRAIR